MPDLLGECSRTSPLDLARKAIRDEGLVIGAAGEALLGEFADSGVRFVSHNAKMTAQYGRALAHLAVCALPAPDGSSMLIEGGVYHGCWLESTGSINTEILSRFCPRLATETFSLFARHLRADGLIPYKITPEGPSYRQIQMVTPLARSVWNHAALNGLLPGGSASAGGAGREFLESLHLAMSRNDAWLAKHRNTRGSGGVEAFCNFDTGSDLSARFWLGSDLCCGEDPAAVDPDSPALPYIAPDLTANVACQRRYLAKFARALGKTAEAAEWERKATASEAVLWERCWHEPDRFFYDEDRHGRKVRVQSDALLRVLACEIGDDSFFARSLADHLLNTRKFFARYPFTSLALDDPRFDTASDHNTWSGPTNTLSVIRAAHAFEAHGRFVEQLMAARPLLSAFFRMKRFAQCVNPWTGDEGFTDCYSPTMLGLLDFVERFSGIQPTPEGTLRFTALAPALDSHRVSGGETSAYERVVDGVRFSWVNEPEASTAYANGERLFSCPRGLRVITDRQGLPEAIVGLLPRVVRGVFSWRNGELPVTVSGNQVLRLDGRTSTLVADPGVIFPAY